MPIRRINSWEDLPSTEVPFQPSNGNAVANARAGWLNNSAAAEVIFHTYDGSADKKYTDVPVNGYIYSAERRAA